MAKVRTTRQVEAPTPAPEPMEIAPALAMRSVRGVGVPALVAEESGDFTYDLTTNVGKVRFEIGDTTNGGGVLPDGANFSDTEIEYMLTQESASVGRATARACEILARQYAGLVDLAVGPRRESLSQAAKAFAERAKELRRQYGGGVSAAYSAGWVRAGSTYATDAVSTGSEYGA